MNEPQNSVSPGLAPASQPAMTAVERHAIRRAMFHIIPLLFLGWFFNYLDRANIGFAALQMNQELGLGPEAFGFAAGIFYFGYIVFEVPSNMLMHRFGARRWLARIMVTWGIVAVGTAFVHTPTQLYIARVLLGVVEAGFFPSVLYYLSLWFPAKHIGTAISRVYAANIIALVVGSPFSAMLMTYTHNFGGLSGWRWMMILEGAPAVLLGIIAFFYLVDRPAQARWLSTTERQWLVDEMAKSTDAAGQHGADNLRAAFKLPLVWLMGLLYFSIGVGFFGVSTWLPQVIKQMSSMSLMEIGFASALPFLFGVIAMIVNARHSDRTLERRWHLTLALALGAVGLAGSGVTSATPLLSYAFICVAAIGIVGSLSVFWTIPPTFLTGTGAAGGMALINAISGLAGFFSPWLVGVVRGHTADFTVTLYVLALSQVVAALLAATLRYPDMRRPRNSAITAQT